MNPYYRTSQLVHIRQVLRLLAVAFALSLPSSIAMKEYIENNLIFKCKTWKMGFLYAPKPKNMTVQESEFEQNDNDEDDAQKLGQRTLFQNGELLARI